MLHSVYVELKAGVDFQGLLPSSEKFQMDSGTGSPLFNYELFAVESFASKMAVTTELSLFLSCIYIQIVNRYPNGGIVGGIPATGCVTAQEALFGIIHYMMYGCNWKFSPQFRLGLSSAKIEEDIHYNNF